MFFINQISLRMSERES